MFDLNKLKKLYVNSPSFVKKVYSLIPYQVRNGSVYRKWIKRLEAKKDLNRSPLESAHYAFQSFGFYKEKYENKRPIEWETIPTLEKWETQEHLYQFEKHNSKKFYVTTGGVSGKPAKFYQSKNVWFKELAFVNSFFKKYGYSPSKLKLSLRGGDFKNLKTNTYWKTNPITNEIHFSPFHLNENTVKIYVKEINKLKPLFFHSYPSGLLRLAQLMEKSDLKLTFNPQCIYLISEAFSKQEHEFLSFFFKCKVTTFYGHSERLIFAEFDEETYSFIPNEQYGYFELLDEKEKVIKENNKRGEIVGTSYDNLTMPLIRYKTGDFTHYVDFSKKAFGPIEGKWGQDKLTGISNEFITITALNLHSNELNDLMRIQFIQIDKGIVEINAIFKMNKTPSQLMAIENLLSNRVGGVISFKIKQTNNFILNMRGKTQLIISNTKQ